MAEYVLKRLDKNKDGKLTLDEMESILPNAQTKQQMIELIAKYDLNKDNGIDVQELRTMLESEKCSSD
ncbi:hypothetical protein FBUS_06111 [Fasciolopsis buskii]|uniref:EF-hand domain-containing protein n=1 Tax=Fasciolopsis buskii TaxID=27845 RepID=A0A8E0RJV3_9TREM|nr:hypothetical protein FBUS_06111 [Fasciolopsis buski]